MGSCLDRFRAPRNPADTPIPTPQYVPEVPSPPAAENTFTQDEIKAMRKNWEHAKTRLIGLEIILSLIRKKPTYGLHFGVGMDQQMNMDHIRSLPQIVAQGNRIQGLLDTIVYCMGQMPEQHMRVMCHRVGTIHYYRGVNFTADTWLTFKRVIIEEVLKPPEQVPQFGEDSNPRLTSEEERMLLGLEEVGWNKLLNIVIQEMKKGFLEEAIKSCELKNDGENFDM